MELDRRGFLIAAGAVVLAPLSVKAVRWRSAAAASAHLFRPDPTGSSSGVCPRCGARDHGALDPGCPANAGPRSAVQAAARAKAAPGVALSVAAAAVGAPAAAPGLEPPVAAAAAADSVATAEVADMPGVAEI